MRRWLSALAAIVLALAAPSGAAAMDRVPYDAAAVSAAQQNGEKIILGIWAVWCSTCQTQIAILDALADDPRFADITIFHIDYDMQKNVMRVIGAAERSQMIAIDGATEIGRLINDIDPAAIEAFLIALVEH
jgi:thiol-disulfide isomerase/thioredoxin